MIVANNIDQYDTIKPARFRVVNFLKIERSKAIEDVSKLNIMFSLRTLDKASPDSLKFFCDECYELKLSNMFLLSGLLIEIEEMRSPFHPNVRYRVYESEENAIEFLCGGFAVELVSE